MTFFVDELHPTIYAIVSSWCESHLQKEISVSKLAPRTIDEGVTYSKRTDHICIVCPVKAENTWNVQFTELRPAQTGGYSTSDEAAGQLFIISGDSMETSDLTSAIDES